jgi:diguanylate cyclase (GGDEF)-like protein
MERIDITSGPLRPLLEDQKPVAFDQDEIPEELTAFAGARHVLFLPLAVRDVLVGAVGLVCTIRDPEFDAVTIEFLHDVVQPIALGMENSRLFSSLAQMATTDELTGLANRRKFMDSLRVEVARSARDGATLSMLVIDVDYLKRINDTHGHPVGDQAIRLVADRLTRRRRVTDLPARLGGEEFGVLLPATDREAALLTAERICREVGDADLPPVGRVTVSIGLASLDEADDGEQLIRLADQRLYIAKGHGRNQVCAESPEEGDITASSEE